MNLKHITALAVRQQELEAAVTVAEEQVKQLKEQLRIVSEVELPEAMEAADLQDFTMQDGSKVTVKPSYYASITQANQDAAFAWLRANGYASLIKHEIGLSFGKGEEDAAKAALAIIEAQGWRAKDKESVHFQTLRAFVREQIEQGSNLPMELFGAQRIVRAAITPPEH